MKGIVEKGNQLSGKERVLYQKKHSQEYQLHEYEKKELERMGIKKLPSDKKINSEIESLRNQQSAERAIQQKLNIQQKKLLGIQSNFERMLLTTNTSVKLHEATLYDQKPTL